MRNNFVVKKSTAEVTSLIGITAVLYATGADMPANSEQALIKYLESFLRN